MDGSDTSTAPALLVPFQHGPRTPSGGRCPYPSPLRRRGRPPSGRGSRPPRAPRPRTRSAAAGSEDHMAIDYVVMTCYLAGIVAVGWWGRRRARSKSDFLVAGRRLGPLMYTGTMAAVVLGGASTIGGVRLG